MMAQNTILIDEVETEKLVEGVIGSQADYEPASPLRTATVPAIITAQDGGDAPSERVPDDLPDGENPDRPDEVQDAASGAGAADDITDDDTAPDTSETATYTVLVVEDDEGLGEVICTALQREQFNAVHAMHGKKAVQTLKTMTPDVILLDLRLPDMKGWGIIEALKEQTEGEADPQAMPHIIVMTATDEPTHRLIGKLHNVHSYVIKPFTAQEIVRQVRLALGISPA
ncbi:MAG: response regulator [Anaerolineaceae bacterium]|nr:MAG: response regulator [Anaerolineaceae bacterium]